MSDNNNNFNDDISVIGGVNLPDHLVFADGDATDVPLDDLGQQLYWLQLNNPGVLKFRQQDVARMDNATKRAMIADFQFALGLAPLKDCVR